MVPITAKVKIAAGIAAGALVLGGAGAYAANANNTVKTYSFTNSGTIAHDNQTLNLVSTKSGQTLNFPTTPFKNEGQCTSWFARNRTLALASTSGTTVKKNFHGKLLSGVQKFCATYAKTETTGDTAETETSDATQTATTEADAGDSADLGDTPAGHGHGHGHGHEHGAD